MERQNDRPRRGNRHQRRASAKRQRQQVFELKFYGPRALVEVLRPDRPMTSDVIAVVKALTAIKAGGKRCAACAAEFAAGSWPGSVMVLTLFPAGSATVGGVCERCEGRGPAYVKAACLAAFREAMPDARETQAGVA